MSDEQSLEDKYSEKILTSIINSRRMDKKVLQDSIKGHLMQFLLEYKKSQES